MKAGLLKHRVKIEQPTTTRDKAGQPIATWTDWPTSASNGFRRAHVVPTGGSEQAIGGALEFVAGFTITMRYRSGLTAGMRITHNSRVMHITSVINMDEAGVWMIAECKEVAA